MTSPERSPPPKRSCSSQRFHGFSTLPSRSIAFSVARTFDACFSERSAVWWRIDLSGSSPLGGLGLRARRSPTTGAGCATRSVSRSRCVRVGLVAGLGVAGGGRAQLQVAGPAAAVLRRGVGDLVDLEHARDRALEEGAVVRDDHGAAGALGDEALQPCQAVEVEVVGRLVEQQDVEAREQDRGQRGARRLAAGERDGLEVEQGGIEPEVAQDGLRALLEVAAAEREPGLEAPRRSGPPRRARRPPGRAWRPRTRASAAATPVRRAR